MPPRRPKLKLMVSSSVYGFEDSLRQIDALLTGFGYETLVSSLGTISPLPRESNFDACVRAVGECDLFLGIIRGAYGSGQQSKTGLADSEVSITHLEIRTAISLDKPRWFLVEKGVDHARQLLKPLQGLLKALPEDLRGPSGQVWEGQANAFKGNSIVNDLRVLAMYEEALLSASPTLAGRWCQPFYDTSEALRFLTTTFKDRTRIQDVLDNPTLPPEDGPSHT